MGDKDANLSDQFNTGVVGGKDRNWSHLFPEILHIILQMLSLPDCFKFGAVCRSWRKIFAQKRLICRPPPCLVRISKDPGMMARQQLWIFHGGKFQMLHSPRPGICDSDYIIGSSMGWLVVGSARESLLLLVNSLSGERIKLPLEFPGTNQMGSNFGDPNFHELHVILSSPPSSVECVVVATGIRARHGFLSICKPGGEMWITTACQYLSERFLQRNIVFYKGELFVLGQEGDILIYEYNSMPRITYRRFIASIDSGVYSQSWVVTGEEFFSVVLKSGGILDVFKLSSGRDDVWEKVDGLGDQLIVIGNNAAESVNIRNLIGSGFEANCIYYIVNGWVNKQMVKFSVASNSIEIIPLESDSEWLVPHSW